MHDLEVLIARTRAVQGSPSAPTLKLSADLDRLVRRLETECRQLHGHYMASRTALLSLCDHVIDGAPRARRPPDVGRVTACRRASSISFVMPSPRSAARSGPTTPSGR